MEHKLTRLFNLIPVVCVICLAVPIVILFLGNMNLPGEEALLPGAACCAVLLGYGLQSLIARIMGLKVERYGFVGRNKGRIEKFRVAFAPIPILLMAVFSVGLYFALRDFLIILGKTGVIERLNDNFIYPFLASIIFFFCGFFGVAIWFYPIERLSNVSFIHYSSVIFVLEVIGASVSTEKSEMIGAIGVCCFVFVICLMLIYNQTNLQRTYLGTVVAAASPTVRLYNLYLVLALFVCLLFTLGVTYVIVRGLYIIGSFLVFLVLYKIFYWEEVQRYQEEYYYPTPEDTAADFTKVLVENGGNTIVPLFFMIAVIIVLLIVGAKTGLLQKLVAYLKEVIREFIFTMKLGREILKETDLYDIPMNGNYKDEKKKLQDASIREYMEMAEGTDSYERFLRRLSKMPNADAQLSFAYAMLVTAYRRKSSNLRLSDTPREIKGKVKHLVSEEEIAYITRQFENVKYGEQKIDEEEASVVLDRICAQVKRYIF